MIKEKLTAEQKEAIINYLDRNGGMPDGIVSEILLSDILKANDDETTRRFSSSAELFDYVCGKVIEGVENGTITYDRAMQNWDGKEIETSAINIRWYADKETLLDTFNDFSRQEQKDLLNLDDFDYDCYQKDNGLEHLFLKGIENGRITVAEVMGLPTRVKIPTDIADDYEKIAEYLSDSYGYLIECFGIEQRTDAYINRQENVLEHSDNELLETEQTLELE